MALSRRDVLRMGLFGGAAMALPLQRLVSANTLSDVRMPESSLPKLFQRPLNIPGAAREVGSSVTNGVTTRYYDVPIQMIQAEIVPGFKTTLFSYGGQVPGPTFRVKQGEKAVVRNANFLPSKHPTLGYTPWTSTHLHGSASLPQYDGYASDVTQPGEWKNYYYPNFQPARTLWYHDHGVHHTAENVYHGMVGFYLMSDPMEQSLGLPQGDYDIPLAVGDFLFQKNGELYFTLDNQSGHWGDVIHVNGTPWPYLEVEPRRYRFRILGASISRSWRWAMSNGMPFTIIGTDGGLMPQAQKVTSFRQLGGERYEVILDFTNMAGAKIQLLNLSNPNNVDYTNTGKVMEFRVTKPLNTSVPNNPIPTTLFPNNPVMTNDPKTSVATRQLRLERSNGAWTVNGTTWDKIEKSNFQFVEASVKSGTSEIWEIVNTSGGWYHPVHVHLVDFKILDRNGKPPFPWELGPKDVIYLGENEKVRILTKFEGHGKYMVHCHNLIHEDHDMMTQFEVVDPAYAGKDDPLCDHAKSGSTAYSW